jgi:hypothetical protein
MVPGLEEGLVDDWEILEACEPLAVPIEGGMFDGELKQ